MNISIEDQLGLINFEVDKEKHIKVEASICKQCIDKPCIRFCPSKRFTLEKEKSNMITKDALNVEAASLPVPKVQ